jgi:organic hydroperoxide reductase OsmC/OhrA
VSPSKNVWYGRPYSSKVWLWDARVVLRPRVTISAGSDGDQALSLHQRAHALCFIARSVNFAVDCEPGITTE